MLCRQCASDIIVLSDAWVVILFDLRKEKNGIITRLYSLIRFRFLCVYTVDFLPFASCLSLMHCTVPQMEIYY